MAKPSPRRPERKTAGFRPFEQRPQLRERPPWWGRLEARITISLVAIGILCVGASSYLVRLTVRYYDALGEQQVQLQREALELAEPYYDEVASAQRESFVARTQLLPHELAALPPEADVEAYLDDWLRARADVLEVAVDRPEDAGEELVVRAPERGGEWIRVPITVPLRPAPSAAQAQVRPGDAGTLRVTWAVDAGIQTRHQRIGELARELGTVEVTGAGGEERTVERDEVQQALIAALGIASGLVLFVAILAGLIIARRTTRKVSDVSEVMRRVASGDLTARAPRLGSDELGQLAGAFNTMLDELEHTRRRIAYLQRVGAWQEMARRIAHEIKNPLTPIQLAVQQLREKDPGTDERFSRLLRDSVEIVEDEVESLRRMVTSFSQFAKVPEVALEPVSLARVLGEFERAWAQVGAELEVVAPPPELEVLGDRQLLKQVLVNLVENAALSAEEAKVDPAVIRVVGDRDGERATIVVEDNGPGIARERWDLVFEPYETTRANGTGLGLAIVKKIVLDHGGEVSVGRSEALGGARFEIRLRVVETSA